MPTSKFSFCIMNPPYGSVGGDVLHLKFVNKCLDIADKQITLMPYNFVKKTNNKASNKYKEKFSEYLISVDEVSGSLFTDTHMPNVGIYVFDEHKLKNNIVLNPINSSNSINIESLLDISNFSKYEQIIISYLDNMTSQLVIGAGRADKRKKELELIPFNKHKEFLDNKIIESLQLLKQYLNDEYKCGLVINQSNGGMNGKAFSSRNGQICNSYDEFKKLFLSLRSSSGYNVILFNSKKAAENCKIALDHPLLRFTIYREQDDQNMYPRVYKHIPNIDWEDDRVKTDEGLLEVCGCPKDKCKEYADYCKKVIQEVDNNE